MDEGHDAPKNTYAKRRSSAVLKRPSSSCSTLSREVRKKPNTASSSSAQPSKSYARTTLDSQTATGLFRVNATHEMHKFVSQRIRESDSDSVRPLSLDEMKPYFLKLRALSANMPRPDLDQQVAIENLHHRLLSTKSVGSKTMLEALTGHGINRIGEAMFELANITRAEHVLARQTAEM